MDQSPQSAKTSTLVEAKVELLAEMVEFIMNSVMIPKKIAVIATPGNPTGEKTVLIPLRVMWNALKEVEARIASEKAAILRGDE